MKHEQYDFDKNFADFLQKIAPTDNDNRALISAKNDIREAISTAFKEMPERYFSANVRTALNGIIPHGAQKIKPAFMTQGSFAYGAINRPAKPVQQMDLDYGVYFPLSYVANATNAPHEAGRVLKSIVYACISDLCAQKKWEIRMHAKCLRIVIKKDAHIDLPLYSVPDQEMTEIREHAPNLAKLQRLEGLDRYLAYKDARGVMLATDDGWVKSDPRVIKRWVNDMKKMHGGKFIRYSRCIKAWRDHTWEESKLSSLMIMAGVAQALGNSGRPNHKNTALDLSSVVGCIAHYLTYEGIFDPDGGDRMDANMPNKSGVVSQIENFVRNLNKSVKTGDVFLLVACLGDRFPDISGISHTVTTTDPSPVRVKPVKQARDY